MFSSRFTVLDQRYSLLALGLTYAAVGLLAAEPARWLVRSWFDSGYDSVGGGVALLVMGLFVWSWSSPIDCRNDRSSIRMFWLLGLTAVLRFASQLLDVSVLGALLLGVDIYALGHLARLGDRKRALDPLWLALVFCLSLPIEALLQRVLGYPLQMVTADLTCWILAGVVAGTQCSGITLIIDGVRVVIDLPCSGSRLLMLCALVLCVGAALKRSPFLAVIMRIPIWLGVVLLGNVLRVSILALASAYAPHWGLLVEPGHSLLGLSILCVCALVIVALLPEGPSRETPLILSKPMRTTPSVLFALPFFAFAASVGGLQPRPVDTSVSLPPPKPAMVAAGFFAQSETLNAMEKRYLATYGGSAQKFSYGPFGLTLASTQSPLRHLHDPLRCFSAAGFQTHFVRLLPQAHSALYRVDHTELGDFDVYVTYVGDDGSIAMSISEAVWRWIQAPDTRWTMIQRVIPSDVDETTARDWHAAVMRMFNVPAREPSFLL